MANPIITAAHAFLSGKPQYTNFFKDVYEITKK